MSDPAPTDDDAPGTLIGKYRVVRVIGRGGMGVVYEVQHEAIRKRLALKRLLPSLNADAEARARFLREARAAARIHHPSVVDVVDIEEDARGAFMVMEFLEGETLAAYLGRWGSLAVADAIDLVVPIASALGATHDEGVIHRDLKPSNVFLARGPHGVAPKLLDFGVSKLVGADAGPSLTRTSSLMGTLAYMSPEQAEDAKNVDAASDQFALGLILYEAVTGAPAYADGHSFETLRAVAEAIFAPPRQLRPDLDPGFESILLAALARRPADRFASVRAFGAALLPYASTRTRALWEAELTRGSSAPDADSPAAPTPVPVARTIHLSTPPVQVAPTPSVVRPGATRMMNAEVTPTLGRIEPADTTLEIAGGQWWRQGWLWLAAAAVIVVVIAGVVIFSSDEAAVAPAQRPPAATPATPIRPTEPPIEVVEPKLPPPREQPQIEAPQQPKKKPPRRTRRQAPPARSDRAPIVD